MRLDFARGDSDIIAKMNGTFVERPRRPTGIASHSKTNVFPNGSGVLTSKAKKSKKAKAGAAAAAAAGGLPAAAGGGLHQGGGGGHAGGGNVDNAPPNQILFLTNLPEETNEMMLSMLFNQVDIIINSLLNGSHSYCPFSSSLDSRRSDWCLEGTTLHLLSLKRRCNRQLSQNHSHHRSHDLVREEMKIFVVSV